MAVPSGHRVHWVSGQVQLLPPSDPLIVGLPVDVNKSEVRALVAIPGVGPSIAQAIVDDREARGLFYGLDDLTRVPGIGPSTLAHITPFVTIGEPGERPPPVRLNLNTASAQAFERLPGIGPVTAARIVVNREDQGPFTQVDSLQRVRGVGPKTLDKLRALVMVDAQ
jgi:competence protein ComEA